MSEDHGENPFGAVEGESALLIALPELDPELGPWLAETSSDGIGAHITVLVPFLPAPELTEEVLAALHGAFGAFAAFDLVFAKTARFPEVLYLVPEPAGPIRDMIAAVYARRPQYPPYGGAFEEPTPHASVLHAKTEAEYDEARRALEPRLPLRTRAAAVELVVFDGSRWNVRERFPLAGG